VCRYSSDGGNTYCFLHWLRGRDMLTPLRRYVEHGLNVIMLRIELFVPKRVATVRGSHVEGYCSAPRGGLTTRCHGYIVGGEVLKVRMPLGEPKWGILIRRCLWMLGN
jgi:hypothetical protein